LIFIVVLLSHTQVLNIVAESHGLICASYWSLTSSVDQLMECWSEMYGGKLQSAAVAENDLVLVRLQLAAGALAVLGMAGQCSVAGC
jgi:hypothetical protein